jgi:hypothetical protein
MAFDPKLHEIHPASGFMVDKESGHPVGLVPPPVPKSALDPEFPKWIEPHESHIEKTGGHISVPLFPFHVQRGSNVVTVMVKDADEEKQAIEAKTEPSTEPMLTGGEVVKAPTSGAADT